MAATDLTLMEFLILGILCLCALGAGLYPLFIPIASASGNFKVFSNEEAQFGPNSALKPTLSLFCLFIMTNLPAIVGLMDPSTCPLTQPIQFYL